MERFTGAADAVTVADIAALFADLPAPHPKLAGPPHERMRRNLVIVGAAAVLALVGSLRFAVGRVQTAPATSPVAAAAPATSGAEPLAD